MTLQVAFLRQINISISVGPCSVYKARLVVKGFNQRPNIDFKETFGPFIKPAIIQLLLSIVISQGWDITQLDVSNAFFNGALE